MGVASVRSGRGTVAVGAQQACRDCGMRLLGSVAPHPCQWEESDWVGLWRTHALGHRGQGVHGGGRISRSCWVGIVGLGATGRAVVAFFSNQWFSVTYNRLFLEMSNLYTHDFAGHMV